jgi:SAM-dependent methyltransferase
VAGNFVDAMALVSKEAWALVGGYDHVRHGWEDYDFWCRIAEVGLAGEWCSPVLAEYRVHPQSMMTIQTLVPGNYARLHSDFERRHPWVALQERHSARTILQPSRNLLEPGKRTRLDDLLPILRCPVTKQKLIANAAKDALNSVDGTQTWPVISGRPVLSRDNASPSVLPVGHISNELPEEALSIIRSTKGWVLNLSAGGSREKFDHVVEVEYAIFRHTDLVADAHVLPFDDESFEAIVVMNAFEHYREPDVVAAELFRILKPGGTVMIRTAFLQPLHERPWHFYNCTKYGLEEWFKAFETDKLHVSENFTPNHSIAWLASECETALRQDVSARTADAFLNAKIGDMVDIWRNPVLRESTLWTEFNKISQTNQEVTAAGFEYFGRKPVDRPKLNG